MLKANIIFFVDDFKEIESLLQLQLNSKGRSLDEVTNSFLHNRTSKSNKSKKQGRGKVSSQEKENTSAGERQLRTRTEVKEKTSGEQLTKKAEAKANSSDERPKRIRAEAKEKTSGEQLKKKAAAKANSSDERPKRIRAEVEVNTPEERRLSSRDQDVAESVE